MPKNGAKSKIEFGVKIKKGGSMCVLFWWQLSLLENVFLVIDGDFGLLFVVWAGFTVGHVIGVAHSC